MITHVAEAGEDRGRVVLSLSSSADLPDVALEAAVTVARAFNSEIESLFIADRQLYDLTGFPFAREISFSGRRSRVLTAGDVDQALRHHASALQRRVLTAASLSYVTARARLVKDEPLRALAQACAENGPWNVVTLGEPMREAQAGLLKDMFDAVEATTGFVVTGPRARRTRGPVVVIADEAERVPGMLRAAERLSAVTGGEPRLWLAGPDRAAVDWIEAEVRLALGLKAAGLNLETVDLSQTSAQTLAARLRETMAGFVLLRYGGALAAPDGDADTLAFAQALDGPLFLVR